MGSTSTIATVSTLLFSVCLIIGGVSLFIDIVSLPIPPLWLSAIAMIVGLTLIWPSEPKTHIIVGLAFFIFGTSTVLGALDIIDQAWLQYGLGTCLFLLGVLLIIYSVRGGTQSEIQ